MSVGAQEICCEQKRLCNSQLSTADTIPARTRTGMSRALESQVGTATFVSELKRWEGSLTFAVFAATLSVLPAGGRRSEVRAFGSRRTLNAMLIVHAVPNYESANAGGNAGTEPAC